MKGEGARVYQGAGAAGFAICSGGGKNTSPRSSTTKGYRRRQDHSRSRLERPWAVVRKPKPPVVEDRAAGGLCPLGAGSEALGWWPCGLVKLDLCLGTGTPAVPFRWAVGMKGGKMSSCGPLISQEMHPTWKEMPINNRNNDIHHCCRRDSPILEIVVPCSTKHSARRSGMMSRAFACTHAHGGSCPYNTVVQKVNVRVPLSNKPAREGQVSRPGWHGEDVQGYLWYVRWQVSASITAHTANDLRQPANGPATPPDNKQPLLFSRDGMPAWATRGVTIVYQP